MKINKRAPFGALLLSCFLAASAYAETQNRQIEEVIVTAERQEASIQDTSISITAFTGEFLDDFGIRNQEDLQAFTPATTIQPYDATVRGVGRNFRALGGDPGVATYMNGIYSEDLLTATAATFWDVERIEVLRGPQGTLYGRNAVGGAINILYKEPTDVFEGAVKAIYGNFGTEEYYGAFSGPLSDTVLGRVNFSYRDRDGVVDEIGPNGVDFDGLGTDNLAVQLKWLATDDVTVDVRHAWMEIDRPFGGSNGAGLVVLNEDGYPYRSTDLIPGYRFIDRDQADPLQSDFYNPNQQVRDFTDPITGEVKEAQPNRAGLDYADFNGNRNAMASLDGFNQTSEESLAAYNACVFPGDIDGNEVCAASNGLNREEYDTSNTQAKITWDFNERLSLVYLYGFNEISYHRTTDEDNTASLFDDQQFYVNHEARYSSHELQAFYEINDSMSVTSGVFWYEATIDQRGDFYSAVGADRFQNAYADNTINFLWGAQPMATLFTAKNICMANPEIETCRRNFSAAYSGEFILLGTGGLDPSITRNDNLYLSQWYGDDGTNRELDVIHGPRTVGSDLLYATQTQRDAFAAYSQGVWDINEDFTLTLGVRYAIDEVLAEENLFRYTESNALFGFMPAFGFTGNPLFQINARNGGFQTVDGCSYVDDEGCDLVTDEYGQPIPTPLVVNGGHPIAVSLYRPFERKDEKVTGRINLDWDISDEVMMYFSATSGYRSGGYNLVFFSNTADYDPEELIAYEIGYKTQFLDNTLQINGSFYAYDYENIHTVATEVTSLGGVSTSVLAAPGGEVLGAEAEFLWLATDALTLGGNFSYTPNEYSKDLTILDPASVETPTSLYPDRESNTSNINGNQLLQVPELKYTLYGTYAYPLDAGATLELSSVYSWTDDVYYSPFENERDMAPSFGRLDFRATWINASQSIEIAAFCNNVLDEVAVRQVLREGEENFFRQNAETTVPRLYGIEMTYRMGAY
jgi:outer membrane receptor protein involved in Fe transport